MALSPDQTPYIASLFSRAHGAVLELGPGAGDQMRHLVEVVRTGQVQRVVGAEPNAALHARLRLNARGVGLDPDGDGDRGRYIALEAGAEPASLIPALHKAGLYPSAGDGVFDTIICVKSLCSTPQAQLPQILTTIQTLLRPGGEFLFFEHVANDSDWVTMAYVWCLGWVWPVAMGNCHLDGRVDKIGKAYGVPTIANCSASGWNQ
ncbi:hypothetical protein LTR70_008546 [Exophiala xenobiotica]|uniref:Uncharacterized protein n=1 Tax=Lithohypha guttulata TaxID=1690604 RepID=A0ABR0K0R2_9EURO|nr:hypothetical protein LTR24_008174 [Lithohypha guttulata]KAK5311820.1 hypothetical protein LTR70_008546 [Exophiala xenobiotica]